MRVVIISDLHGNYAAVFCGEPREPGQPKTGKQDACYAVWENGNFQLKSFRYPVKETEGRIKSLAFPIDVEKDLITVLQTGSV